MTFNPGADQRYVPSPPVAVSVAELPRITSWVNGAQLKGVICAEAILPAPISAAAITAKKARNKSSRLFIDIDRI